MQYAIIGDRREVRDLASSFAVAAESADSEEVKANTAGAVLEAVKAPG